MFSLQVFPVKEISKSLYKIAVTDDLDEDCKDEFNKSKKESEPYIFLQEKTELNLTILPESNLSYLIHDERLLAFHLPDTLTPPPNRIFFC